MDLGVAVEGHPYAGVDQEHAEDVDHPVVALEQTRPEEDEDATQHERPDHAPEKHPVLVARGHGKVGEDEGEHEHVVDREAFLDDVARQVLGAACGASHDENEDAEEHRNAYPENA